MDLSKLPPPPKNQVGMSLDQIKGLPPPPQGQQGMTLDQVNQLGTLPKPISKSMPILTNEQGGIGTAMKDIAVGAGKDLMSTARDTASGLQSLGKGALGMIGIHEQGLKSLDNSTPEGSQINEQLKAKSRGEQTGKVLSGITQVVAPFAGGNAEKLIAKGKSVYEGFKTGQEAKTLTKLADATSGVADKGTRISTLEQSGALDKTGKPIGGASQSLMGGIKAEPTSFDLARVKDVQGIVKPGASPVKNLVSINREIGRISEKEITPALKRAGVTTPISKEAPGWNKTVQRLTDIEKPDIIKADSTLDKTYDLVKQRMIDQIQKQPDRKAHV